MFRRLWGIIAKQYYRKIEALAFELKISVNDGVTGQAIALCMILSTRKFLNFKQLVLVRNAYLELKNNKSIRWDTKHKLTLAKHVKPRGSFL